MRWVTHYPARRRRNPWFRRFLAGLGCLALALTGWLWWKPVPKEAPEVLLGLPPKSMSEPAAPGTNTASTEEGAVSGHLDAATSPPPRLPSSVVDRLTATSPPALPFKPNPSVIVPPAPSHAWHAVPAQTVLEAQIALARQGLSSGSIDGLNGPKTRAAVRAFQQMEGLPATGALNRATKERLLLTEPPLTRHTVSAQDLARLAPVPQTWLGKAAVPRLEYETLLELVAERWQASPELIRQLNQDLDWRQVTEGTTLIVPNARSPLVRAKAAAVRIRLEDRLLEVLDAATNRVALFPCSIAREVRHRLVGLLHVTTIAHDPEYLFVPSRFRQTAEVRQIKNRLRIPPGPNNPVGNVWIGLDREGYGIHGTPYPERIGEAASLGCFRLSNWNAQLLAQLAWVGMPVEVTP